MLCFPNAKINLGLSVIRRRSDGYHDLSTILYPIPLREPLEVVRSTIPELEVTGMGTAIPREQNIVWKAYQLLQDKFPDKVPPLHIYLHKVIPMGAGLGGGSANGAFLLRAVSDLCRLRLSQEQLALMALSLGSDCPFFIYNTPHLASGRGEKLEALDLDLTGYTLQLICPKLAVSTAAAYRLIHPAQPKFDLRQLPALPVEKWEPVLTNDFEPIIFKLYPDLADLKKQLYNQGAFYASMSGSGSALFALFPKDQKAVIHSALEFDEFVFPL